jgi:DNA repair photolyase
MIRKKSREGFINAAPRKDIIQKLEDDLQKLNGSPKESVLLCFMCDPYQQIDVDMKLTRLAIRALNRHGFPVQILTKGGTRATRDFDILAKNPSNKFAVTLTTDDPAESLEWEPGAAPPEERIESLRQAHKAGIETWVSFEPAFNPDAVYRLIEQTNQFVDLYKVGKINYHPRAKEIDWRKFRVTTESILKSLGKKYYIKDDLRAFV